MRRIAGLREIAGDFDAMLIDQFGVIHDGKKPYPHAAEVMAQLQARDIPVVVLTNSGKRTVANVERLVRMGIPRDQFVDCVSSGEVAFRSLNVSTAFLIGRDDEDYGFEPITLVPRAEDAEVMLILGSNAPRTSLAQYRVMLERISIPAVCCNPDKMMITSQGLQFAPGAIAALYEELGGTVTWIGKPYPGIYEYALSLLKPSASRVLCIGDSAEHDVGGGRNAGLATLLVQQGVSQGLDEEALHPKPDYIIKDFTW